MLSSRLHHAGEAEFSYFWRLKNHISHVKYETGMMALTVCCFGCSGAERTLTVALFPADGIPSSGRMDAEGNQERSCLDHAKGAILGSSQVSITTGKPVVAEVDAETDLSADVKAGSNTFDFKLDTK